MDPQSLRASHQRLMAWVLRKPMKIETVIQECAKLTTVKPAQWELITAHQQAQGCKQQKIKPHPPEQLNQND